jgi:hypothetical protein
MELFLACALRRIIADPIKPANCKEGKIKICVEGLQGVSFSPPYVAVARSLFYEPGQGKRGGSLVFFSFS